MNGYGFGDKNETGITETNCNYEKINGNNTQI